MSFGIKKNLTNEDVERVCNDFTNRLSNLDEKTKRNLVLTNGLININAKLFMTKDIKEANKLMKIYRKVKYLVHIEKRTRNKRSKERLQNRIYELLLRV